MLPPIQQSLTTQRCAETRQEGENGKIYVVCPECGKETSTHALLCRECYKRAGGVRAMIYRAAEGRGELDEAPTRAYHKNDKQVR
jgi:predicted amidophosphoribosyltransferase